MLQWEMYFPFWQKLEEKYKIRCQEAIQEKEFKKEELISDGTSCEGLLLVESGRLRIYTTSNEGRELTLYRLLEGDVCLFSASCVLHSLQFDIMIAAETTTKLYQIPATIFQEIMQDSLLVTHYVNEIMATRLTDIMWILEQVHHKKMDSRIAAFLVEESALTDTFVLTITHETIARHLGTAREVVTRMLQYFQKENWIVLRRNVVEIREIKQLQMIAEESLR